MHDFFVSAVAFIVLVGLMVVVHEFGHFLVANFTQRNDYFVARRVTPCQELKQLRNVFRAAPHTYDFHCGTFDRTVGIG